MQNPPNANADVAASVGAITLRLRRAAFTSVVSGAGAALVIAALAQLSQSTGALLLVAPFGASSVLLFALPQSPLARPRNVIGGHIISALAGLIVLGFLENSVIACALGVGLAIAAMQFTETLHPPAGGTPLVVILTGAGWQFLVAPILAGTLILVCSAWLYHRFISRRDYPLRAI